MTQYSLNEATNHDAKAQNGQIEQSLHDVTDQVYHTLSMFEQLCARLEERCNMLDATLQSSATEPDDVLRSGGKKEPHYRAIAELMADPDVSDILINGPDQIYVEKGGTLKLTDYKFENENELIELAHEIAHFCGRVVDKNNPLVDARLPDGSRVNIVTPPVAIDGISMSIRKFGDGSLSLSNMANKGCMTQQMAEFLRCCADAHVNMVVAGGTGAGKTTLLNAICKHIDPADRVVTIEDSAELRLPIPHVVRLESITHDEAGRKQVSMRQLLKNSLRMRPNRIIVGEVRGAEAFDMIQAMNTGHDGSLTTIHANTPRDGVTRIENMVGMSDMKMPPNVIRKQIASAVNIMVQLERSDSGQRYIKSIAEVVGMEGEVITMQDIFTHKEIKRPDGSIQSQHQWTNVYPRHAKLNQLLRERDVLKITM